MPYLVALWLSVPVHTPPSILLYMRRSIVSATRPHRIREGASQGKSKCHAAEARPPRGMTGLEQNGHVCAGYCREADLEGARSRGKKLSPSIIKFGGRM